MCRATVDAIATTHTKIDINAGNLPDSISPENAQREIHFIDEKGVVYKNVDALLQMLGGIPKYKLLVNIASLPVIKSILKIGYAFVAKHRHFIFGPESRITMLSKLLAIAFLGTFLLSFKLWISTRFYPVVPVFSFLRAVFPWDYILFFCALISSVCLFISSESKKKLFTVTTVILILLLGICDQSRWMPYNYLYLCLLTATLVYYWNNKPSLLTINAARLIVSFVYVWAGIHKINYNFIFNGFPSSIPPFIAQVSFLQPLVLVGGCLIPFVEIFIGLGLLTRKFRLCALFAALLTHCVIIFQYLTGGLVFVPAVFYWNMMMIALVITLFLGTRISLKEIFLRQSKILIFPLGLVLFIIPVTSFFYDVDTYLSWSIFAGKKELIEPVSISKSVRDGFPAEIQKYTFKSSATVSSERYFLDVYKWSLGELGVFPYPEKRVFAAIVDTLCVLSKNEENAQTSDDILTKYHDRPKITTGVSEYQILSCKP